MRSFASDNNSGVHPAVMEAIFKANEGHAVGYGADDWTKKADACLASVFGADVTPFYVFNGTGSNMLALQVCTRPIHSIITAETGHINLDECGAPAHFTSCTVKEVITPDGKLTPDLIAGRMIGFGDQHHSQPKVIYLSQSTEMGTVYTLSELRAICEYAHKFGMYVHMDGSRLANACATLGIGMRELSRDCGVDILSLGGTKNGMMMGEAVLAFRPELVEHLKFHRKQSAQLYSKMRFLSAQFLAYFENNLWLKNAHKANAMASLLAEKIKNLPGIRFTQKVEANALFLTMPPRVIEQMRASYFFYTWSESTNEVRLVCSWDTTTEDIYDFVASLEKIIFQSK